MKESVEWFVMSVIIGHTKRQKPERKLVSAEKDTSLEGGRKKAKRRNIYI